MRNTIDFFITTLGFIIYITAMMEAYSMSMGHFVFAFVCPPATIGYFIHFLMRLAGN